MHGDVPPFTYIVSLQRQLHPFGFQFLWNCYCGFVLQCNCWTVFCSVSVEWCFHLVCVPRHRVAKYRCRAERGVGWRAVWRKLCSVQGLHYYYYYYYYSLATSLSALPILQQDSPQFGRCDCRPVRQNTVDVKFCWIIWRHERKSRFPFLKLF